jgi:hypothetical protein
MVISMPVLQRPVALVIPKEPATRSLAVSVQLFRYTSICKQGSLAINNNLSRNITIVLYKVFQMGYYLYDYSVSI